MPWSSDKNGSRNIFNPCKRIVIKMTLHGRKTDFWAADAQMIEKFPLDPQQRFPKHNQGDRLHFTHLFFED
jgi:hypothetical protein